MSGDEIQKHPFEVAGLGSAPFECTHVVYDAGLSCQYCGQTILHQYWIRGADGSTFFVGSSCVSKTGGGIHVKNFDYIRKQHNKKMLGKRKQSKNTDNKMGFMDKHPGWYEAIKSLQEKCIRKNDWASAKLLAGMVDRIYYVGELTPHQTASLLVMMEQDEKRQAINKQKNAQRGDAAPLMVPILSFVKREC